MRTRTIRPAWRIAISVIRSSWLLSAVFGLGLLASGCSNGNASAAPVKSPVVRPKSFGPPGKCYYVVSPVECANQQAPGVPTPMPPVWLATYWPYYSSSAYFSQVPAEDDQEYAEALGTFAAQNNQTIVDDESDGEWVDQDGNTWEGDPGDDPPAESSSDDGDGGDDGGDGGDDGGDGGDDG